METELSLGVFEVPELWRKSILTVPDEGASFLFGDLKFDLNAIPLHNPYVTKDSLGEHLRLPSLDTFQYGANADQQVNYESSEISTEVEEIPEPEQKLEEDVWLQIEDIAVFEKHHLSWENFNNGGQVDRYQTPFLSECGPLVFNAAIEQVIKTSATPLRQGPIAKADIVLKSLLDLACGRSSVLYAWDEKQRTFRSLYHDLAATGLSTMALTSVSNTMTTCGNNIRHLSRFVDKTYGSASSASKIAMANVASAIISAIEMSMLAQTEQISSLLQLQQHVERPGKVLGQLVLLLKELRDAQTDEQASSTTYLWCHRTVDENPWFMTIAREILSRVSTPLLNKIGNWTGLSVDHLSARTVDTNLSFIVARLDAQENDAADYTLSEDHLPAFLTPELGRTVLETGAGLRLLQEHHPNHVLSSASTSLPEQALAWQQSWSKIDGLLASAKTYEADLSDAVHKYKSSNVPTQSSLTTVPQLEVEDQHKEVDTNFYVDFDQSLHELNQSPSASHSKHDRLTNLVQAGLQAKHNAFNSDFANPPSIDISCDLSFGPLLHAQARLVRGACIRALFSQHRLQEHLSIQRSFHFMGDGVFVTRLTAALFDTSAASTERQLGVMRSGHQMGLNLGQRSSWPPASSELRLALMGILSDCYAATTSSATSTTQSPDIPGGLSFAIRNLDDDEVSRVLQPGSLYALDFLRLQYSAPSPINSIITSSATEKYDTIFKFLLKLARLTFVVAHFPRRDVSAHVLSFAHQVRHFVDATVRYFFDTAIAEPWTAFEKHVDSTAKALDEEDALNLPMMRDIGGIEDLQRRHHECLDAMLLGLLLRHRQSKVMALLEEIYGHVLGFDALCRSNSPVADTRQETMKLQRMFEDRVAVFLDVCRGLGAKRAYGSSSGGNNSADGMWQRGYMIERLVDAVDFNGFYASRKKRTLDLSEQV